MRRRIFFGVTGIALIVLVVGVILAAGVNRRFQAEVRDDLFRQAEATATVVGSQLSDALSGRDGSAIDAPRPVLELIETVRLVGGHDIVEVGLVVAGRVRPVGPEPVVLPDEPPIAERSLSETVIGGVPMAVAIVGIEVDVGTRTRPAVVAIARSTDLPGSGLSGALVLSLGVGALLAVALAAWLARSNGKAVDELALAAQTLAGGEFAVRAPESGVDEVADLGRAFNEMASRLEEGRVREREFLMSVSHDLRTPLTTIRGYGEALAEDDVPADDLRRVGGVIGAQAQRLGRLVEDLMTLGRLEAGHFTVHREEVDLAAHVRELLVPFADRAKPAGLRMSVAVDEVGVVTTDPDRVGQVVGNLVENALRHTPEGGTISARLGPAADGVEFSVTDTGPGIEAEELDRIFDRRYVADRHRPLRPEGSGLGLAITRQLVVLLGGTLDVASTPGTGSTFSVRLPRQ
ncbi:MAG: HAMP domain-containing histidine kinase [Acidimicrobiia bacterium]|nr:HAMP domain-containing histidine kinase [Acidimicrobiia bacterium]